MPHSVPLVIYDEDKRLVVGEAIVNDGLVNGGIKMVATITDPELAKLLQSNTTPTGHSIVELDVLHKAVGLDVEWQNSPVRAEIEEKTDEALEVRHRRPSYPVEEGFPKRGKRRR